MERIARASLLSASAFALLSMLVLVVQETLRGSSALGFLSVGVIIIGCLVWILGMVFSVAVLSILKPVADFTHPSLSLAIFALVGFAIPAWLLWIGLGAGSHDQPPPVATKSGVELAARIMPLGLAGAGSSVLAWYSIRRSQDHAGGQAPSTQSPNPSLERTREG